MNWHAFFQEVEDVSVHHVRLLRRGVKMAYFIVYYAFAIAIKSLYSNNRAEGFDALWCFFSR